MNRGSTSARASSRAITCPSVNPDVIRSGLTLLTPVTAVVTLQGVDDAGFPVDLQFGVPINFIRAGN
jgi:hypothetical protein